MSPICSLDPDWYQVTAHQSPPPESVGIHFRIFSAKVTYSTATNRSPPFIVPFFPNTSNPYVRGPLVRLLTEPTFLNQGQNHYKGLSSLPERSQAGSDRPSKTTDRETLRMSGIPGEGVDSFDDVESDSARGEPASTTPSDDVVFEILTNSRRRAVLQYLDETSGGATKGELADYVAAMENDKSISELRSQERKRVYVSLYQFHLPKMTDAGVIRIENDRTIRLADGADRCMEHLEESAADRRWYRYYLVVSFAWIFAYVSGMVSNSNLWLGLIIGGFVMVSVLHWLESTTMYLDNVQDAITRLR